MRRSQIFNGLVAGEVLAVLFAGKEQIGGKQHEFIATIKLDEKGETYSASFTSTSSHLTYVVHGLTGAQVYGFVCRVFT
jgi:hypothetical protein